MAEQPDEQELRRRLEEELQRLRVADVLAQTLYTLSSLGYARLAPEGRDLEQVRLAIDAVAALVPLLEPEVPADVVRDFNQVKANLQLAYAAAVAEQPAAVPKETDGDG